MTRAFVALAVAVALLLVPLGALAHVRSVSWSTWTIRGDDVTVRVRIARLDLSAHPLFSRFSAAATGSTDDERALADYLLRHLRAETAAGPCTVDTRSYQLLDADDGFIARTWAARCANGEPRRLTSELLLEQMPSHLHFASLARDGAPVVERLLTVEARTWELGAAPRAGATRLFGFVALGARHVATGADHIVFVLALLVAATSLRSVAGVVTGFTVGHSVTLALAVAGGVRPNVTAIEALVGASIAVVAVENVWLERRDPWLARGLVVALAAIAAASALSGRGAPLALGGLGLFVACYFGLLSRSSAPARLRWTVAALFGTVHGFAFSGALTEMSLPKGRLVSALFGFNVGVELAQLALVALAWPLWRLLAKTRARGRALDVASAAALCAGVFWLLDRTFG